jgi:ABC-type amino acid transport substrate-binding protein
MPFRHRSIYCFFLAVSLFFHEGVRAQTSFKADSWAQALDNKKGTITALWYDIEPFIYRDGKDGIMGVEYELMEGLKGFVKKQYGVDLAIDWVDAGSFENIYPQVKTSTQKGLFGLSFYSITDERKKDVKFSPPYMPDMNILVTNNNDPVYTTDLAFIEDLRKQQGFTMQQTTMEEDIMKLKQLYYPGLPVSNKEDDYEVLKEISRHPHSFGYVPVSIYVVALQRGIKIKRQSILATKREGFAAIYTKASDWDEPVQAYFNSTACHALVSGLIKKYLGEEVAGIILGVSGNDPVRGRATDIELLTKEREIVTKRLMDTAVEVQKQRSTRNTMLVAVICLLLLAGVLFSRFTTKKKLHKKLAQRNQLISKQNDQIEQMNQLLKLKVLQAKMNPHFLFNSLNSIQYFISADDKKASLQYISRFSAFLRKLIHFGDELSITLKDEAELLKEYLWLEHTRFPGQFEYQVNLPEELQQAKILPLLTHGLVEAALYRGVLNLDEGKKGMIHIDFSGGAGKLCVQVTDNGMTREDAGELEKRKGLVNGEEDTLNRRIRLFNRQGNRKIHLRFETIKLNHAEGANSAKLEVPQPLFDSSIL